MDLLRFSTAGSVDDGKSTLIGRLLYDSKGIFEDQLAAIERTSRRRGYAQVDLALLTDGLRAEREQGITIDVAYRYFATPRRKFIIADTPGHIQYTRNMVTGASTADLAIVLIDARNGVLEQSRRHAFIAALLGIPHLVVAVNKMDLVGYSEEVFERIQDGVLRRGRPSWTSMTSSSSRSPRSTATTSSQRSLSMPWYQGPSLLYHLEHVYIASDRNLIDARFPVQWVIRPQTDEHHDFRGYAGPDRGAACSRRATRSSCCRRASTAASRASPPLDGELETAAPPLSVVIQLEDDMDVSRGDMLCRPHNQPTVAQEIEAMVCWMADAPLKPGAPLLAQAHDAHRQGDRGGPALSHRRQHAPPGATATQLGLNEIGRVQLRTSAPLMADEYRDSRTTGGFILIDEATSDTVGRGHDRARRSGAADRALGRCRLGRLGWSRRVAGAWSPAAPHGGAPAHRAPIPARGGEWRRALSSPDDRAGTVWRDAPERLPLPRARRGPGSAIGRPRRPAPLLRGADPASRGR